MAERESTSEINNISPSNFEVSYLVIERGPHAPRHVCSNLFILRLFDVLGVCGNHLSQKISLKIRFTFTPIIVKKFFDKHGYHPIRIYIALSYSLILNTSYKASIKSILVL